MPRTAIFRNKKKYDRNAVKDEGRKEQAAALSARKISITYESFVAGAATCSSLLCDNMIPSTNYETLMKRRMDHGSCQVLQRREHEPVCV